MTLNIINFQKKNKTFKKNRQYPIYTFSLILKLIISLYLIIIITNQISYSNISIPSDNELNHISKNITVYIYNTLGNLQLKLIANHVQYSLNQKIIWFKEPKITIFDKNNIKIWEIRCNQAILNNKTILNLNGYVYINKLSNNISLQSIITHQIIINLTTQIMTSNAKTIIHGYHFYSIGSKMYSNLSEQIIQLFKIVYTQYEIQ